MKSRKGQYGYFDHEKKRRLLLTIGMFAIPVLIYVTGYLYAGTRNNLMTVVAMVGMIPAALSLTGLIMIMMRRSIPKEEFDQIDPHIGVLTYAYELFLTSEKKNAMVDCLVICGNSVVGLVTDKKTDARFAADHLKKMLRTEGYKVDVHMLQDIRHFTERLDSLNAHAPELREGIPFKEDKRYPGLDREDLIRFAALNLSI